MRLAFLPGHSGMGTAPSKDPVHAGPVLEGLLGLPRQGGRKPQGEADLPEQCLGFAGPPPGLPGYRSQRLDHLPGEVGGEEGLPQSPGHMVREGEVHFPQLEQVLLRTPFERHAGEPLGMAVPEEELVRALPAEDRLPVRSPNRKGHRGLDGEEMAPGRPGNALEPVRTGLYLDRRQGLRGEGQAQGPRPLPGRGQIEGAGKADDQKLHRDPGRGEKVCEERRVQPTGEEQGDRPWTGGGKDGAPERLPKSQDPGIVRRGPRRGGREGAGGRNFHVVRER